MSQAVSTAPSTRTHVPPSEGPTRALWRAAGGFAIAHVAVMLAGIALAFESPLSRRAPRNPEGLRRRQHDENHVRGHA